MYLSCENLRNLHDLWESSVPFFCGNWRRILEFYDFFLYFLYFHLPMKTQYKSLASIARGIQPIVLFRIPQSAISHGSFETRPR
jgi:hypothetical protein